MQTVLRLVSFLGLTLSVVPPLLLWAGRIDLATNHALLIVGMFLWFGTAIFWIKHEKTEG
jgi:hypothetical protein